METTMSLKSTNSPRFSKCCFFFSLSYYPLVHIGDFFFLRMEFSCFGGCGTFLKASKYNCACTILGFIFSRIFTDKNETNTSLKDWFVTMTSKRIYSLYIKLEKLLLFFKLKLESGVGGARKLSRTASFQHEQLEPWKSSTTNWSS